MNDRVLVESAKALVAGDKGLLAIDESTPTCNKRFAKLGIAETVEVRRAYREMIVTTPELNECISGVILYDETMRQQTKAGIPFVSVFADTGIIPCIKVDTGAKDLAASFGEKVTEGLDGLRDRLVEYHHMGARFAKWRCATRGSNPQAQHGASGIRVRQPVLHRRGGGCYGQLLLARGPCRCSRHRVLVGRTIRRACVRAAECDERSIHVTAAVGADVLVRSRDPAARARDLARRGVSRVASA